MKSLDITLKIRQRELWENTKNKDKTKFTSEKFKIP